MPPKRENNDAALDDNRRKFQKRGDLLLYHLGTKSDCAVMMASGERILVHRAFMMSRSGFFKQLLTKKEKLPVDHRGRTVIEMDSHDIKSLRLVVEFIYGEWMVEMMEYPSENQPIIQDCILLYNLGHDFGVPKMITYATKHLGMHLSRKLKDICVYPVPKALEAVAPRGFMEDLEAAINEAEKIPQGDQENHPRRMLIDFIVAGRDILFRDAGFRFSIDQDFLPSAFIKDVLLAQYGKYQTQWMAKLMVRPEMLAKAGAKKRGNCAGCGEGVTKDQTVVFNPWSQRSLAQRYTQFCCEDCSLQMDEGMGSGVSWEVFDDVKEE